MERKDGPILLSPRLDKGQRQKIKCLKWGAGRGQGGNPIPHLNSVQ